MTAPQHPLVEFPLMLHGLTDDVHRQVEEQGRSWSREYLETGRFTLPLKMARVPPGELLLMHDGGEFELIGRSSWHIHMFASVFVSLDEGVPEHERQRIADAFETFCLGTPWGALYHAADPPPKRSAMRMAHRFDALLRFWDVLQTPRYAHHEFNILHTLDELICSLHQVTMDAWCPGPFSSVREQLVQVARRMAHATREDSVEAMLRVIPHLLRTQPKLPHRERLGAPGFARERLATVSASDFESASSADRFQVNGLLHAWSRELSRP